ncbi:helix-turn-helix domain-containing protein [Thauera sp. 2A1]|uniref:helix-turn-helix domain-containing protein n=1 Tax=Thauera sp. 2A1 TaxID=2570191 RepID=UPI0012919976|nr:helix-turn-helix domain-containing protein [Thauera sp. 2A1]KAI5914594.1 helix-turn-helix domain containing protein [Thauera sp. 2A1]
MQSTDLFTAQLVRLKYLLDVQEDQAAAEALGMSKAALSARKSRGSFPEKELRALAQRRPDLGIDVNYVLTGEPPPDDGGDETDDEFACRIQAVSRMHKLVEALPLDELDRLRLAALMSGTPQQDAPLIAEFVRRALPPEPAERVLLENYRRCNDEGKAYLVQESALMAAGLKGPPGAAAGTPAGTTAPGAPQVFNGIVGAVAGRDVKNVSVKQGKSRKNE